MKHLCVLLCFISLVFGYANAQSKKEQGLALFKNGQYEDVISVVGNERKLLRQDPEVIFILGVSYYQENELNKAQSLFNQLLERKKNVYPECWWYLGQIAHTKQKFTDAAAFYKSYLLQLRDNHPQRQMVIDAIRNCSNGIKYLYKSGLAEIDNLGRAVNSDADEFAPVVSPNFQNRLYFSSIRAGNMGVKRNKSGRRDDLKGNYLSDIYSCELERGGWGNVKALDYLVNSPVHDILLDFGHKGQTMYLFKGQTMNNGQILVDTFKQEGQRSIATAPFISPIRAESGDGMLFIVDENLILFASNELEGYGGYDLYQLTRAGGRWSNPENLGPDINTQYDEITPFLALDGRTLYYSSNNSYYSIGGFDVLKSIYVPDIDRWLDPQNLRAPINSPADDTHLRLNKDGTTAFFCSSRKDGFGERDIYIAYFKNYLAEMEPSLRQTNLVKPQASTKPDKFEENNNPPFDTPEPLVENTVPQDAPNFSEPIVEKPEEDAFSTSQQVSISDPNSLDKIDNIKKIQQTIDHLFENPNHKLVISVFANDGASLFEAITVGKEAGQSFLDAGIPRKSVFIKAIHHQNEPRLQLDIVSDFEMGARGMVSPINAPLCYKVQIVSVQKEYQGALLKKYNWPMVEMSFNGQYYRYTLGAFDNYQEAKLLRNSIRSQGAPDAYIVPYINGFRANKIEVQSFVETYPDLKNYLAGK